MGIQQFEAIVQRSPGEVFAFLTDFEAQPRWLVGVLEARQDPKGLARAGTTIRTMRKTAMGKAEFMVEITACDPQRHSYDDLTIDGPFRGSWGKWRVEPEGAGSRLAAEVEIKGTGWRRILIPLVNKGVKKEMTASIENLKRIVEQQPAPPTPAGGSVA